MMPTPTKMPPIIIGGHSKPAYRRAGQYANGVNFVSLSEDELVERLAIVNDYRKQYGRENEDFEVYAGMPAFSVDDKAFHAQNAKVIEPFSERFCCSISRPIEA